jgi:hypothetical protein
MRRPLALALASALAFAGLGLQSPARASAQSAHDDERAEVVFNAGKQLRDARQYAEACSKFAESERLAPGVGIMLHLADCYERSGRYATAWAKFRQAEQLAFQHNDCRALLAHTRAAALEAKVNRLTVVVAKSELHSDWELQFDGLPLPHDYWNAEMATDPGYHVVTVNAPGRAPRTIAIHVDAGTRESVVTIDEAAGMSGATPPAALAVHQAGDGVAPAPVPPPAPDAAQTRSVSHTATWQWVERGLLGATVVGFGAGASLLAVKNQAVLNGRPGTSNDSSWAGPASTIAFAAGGAALAAAIVVYLAAPSDKSTGAILVPVPMAGGGGAMIRTSF